MRQRGLEFWKQFQTEHDSGIPKWKLMEKYGLSKSSIHYAVKQGWVTIHRDRVKYDYERIQKDINDLVSYKEILEKYGLSEHTLYRAFRTNKLVKNPNYTKTSNTNISDRMKLIDWSMVATELQTSKVGVIRRRLNITQRMWDVAKKTGLIPKNTHRSPAGKWFFNSERYLRKGSMMKSSSLKKHLIAGGFLKNECRKCTQGPTWQGRPLTLELDHINGDNRDNRLENLRILCPNCHTQTPTWGRKRWAKKAAA